MKRQLPSRHDLAPLLKFKKPVLSPKQRRLASALTIEDLRRIAKRRTPRAAFDYTDGAADGEVSLARAREAFAEVAVVDRYDRPPVPDDRLSLTVALRFLDPARTLTGQEVQASIARIVQALRDAGAEIRGE